MIALCNILLSVEEPTLATCLGKFQPTLAVLDEKVRPIYNVFNMKLPSTKYYNRTLLILVLHCRSPTLILRYVSVRKKILLRLLINTPKMIIYTDDAILLPSYCNLIEDKRKLFV